MNYLNNPDQFSQVLPMLRAVFFSFGDGCLVAEGNGSRTHPGVTDTPNRI